MAKLFEECNFNTLREGIVIAKRLIEYKAEPADILPWLQFLAPFQAAKKGEEKTEAGDSVSININVHRIGFADGPVIDLQPDQPAICVTQRIAGSDAVSN